MKWRAEELVQASAGAGFRSLADHEKPSGGQDHNSSEHAKNHVPG
jgi:hypothetical protein